ncbi:RnfABCDGE type electron transport complex subunit D [Candidatus Azambacteria bacterium]|nr:RnfABCDGE type electron transport complex subunit D [Candidatus Azambacteria bacterium]
MTWLERLQDRDTKEYLLGFLVILAIVGIIRNGAEKTIPQLFISLAATSFFDILFNTLEQKPLYFPKSALVSGLIIAMVLAVPQPWYVLVFAGAFAMVLKHFLRPGDRHIFNPGGSGVMAAHLVFGASFGWWGEAIPELVIVGGLLVIGVFFLRVWIPVTYAIGYFLFWGLAALTGYGNLEVPALAFETLTNLPLFLMFIMLPEPWTSPRMRNGQIAFAALASFLTILFFPIRVVAGVAPVLGLLIANLTVPFLNRVFVFLPAGRQALFVD